MPRMGSVDLQLEEVAKAKGVANPFALARETGLNYAICYRLWHRQTTLISLTTLARLCDALKSNPGELLSYRREAGRKRASRK